ncbi:MAG: protein translocase subunit SecD [Candidatus Peribacteraceae bacterium]|nr:protein translocase subunit SecD [Candidatus Peribacteraceae bacterium]
MEEAITVRAIFFSLLPTGWKDTLLDGKHFRSATVTIDSTTNIPIVQIVFDDEGAKLFQELTKQNIDKRLAIFVGGQLVSAPTVQQEIVGGIAVITGSSNFDEANTLAQDLNTGAIPAPIYLAGQRTVEATLGAEALRTSLKAALLGVLILMGYMLLTYRFLGLLADIALSVYALLFFAMLKLPLFLFTSNYIVLTLAGMAGIILSLGMAVDANVLIFERMKEELRKGKMLKTAAETGFTRAWPSIRDGNVSTLITCSILFAVGTSIVKGFAVTLGMGVLISMFSAIVITRWLIRKVSQMKVAEKTSLFCG